MNWSSTAQEKKKKKKKKTLYKELEQGLVLF